MSVWVCTTYQKLGRIVLFQGRKFDLFTRYYSHLHECGLGSTYARNFVKLLKFSFKDINFQVINCVKNITYWGENRSIYYLNIFPLSCPPSNLSTTSLIHIISLVFPYLLFPIFCSSIPCPTLIVTHPSSTRHILTHTNLSVSVVIYIP